MSPSRVRVNAPGAGARSHRSSSRIAAERLRRLLRARQALLRRGRARVGSAVMRTARHLRASARRGRRRDLAQAPRRRARSRRFADPPPRISLRLLRGARPPITALPRHQCHCCDPRARRRARRDPWPARLRRSAARLCARRPRGGPALRRACRLRSRAPAGRARRRVQGRHRGGLAASLTAPPAPPAGTRRAFRRRRGRCRGSRSAPRCSLGGGAGPPPTLCSPRP